MNVKEMREKAFLKKKNKEYKEAIDLYSDLVEFLDKEENVFNDFENIKVLIFYAECLVFSQNCGDNIDEDLFETAWISLEKARNLYLNKDDCFEKNKGLIYVYDIQGDMMLKNGNYSEAVKHYDSSVKIGFSANDIPWRMKLASLFNLCSAYKYLDDIDNFAKNIDRGIKYIDEILTKDELEEKERDDLNLFKNEFLFNKTVADKLMGNNPQSKKTNKDQNVE